MRMSRQWAMPSSDTLDIPPLRELVRLYQRGVSVDPFARDRLLCTYTNDLNPHTRAEFHFEALEFAAFLLKQNVSADFLIFDPPYSPRQLAEVYQSVGRAVTTQDTQAATWAAWRDAYTPLLSMGGVALSLGWNSSGFGRGRGFELLEVMLVCHGGMHHDTIAVVERRVTAQQALPFDLEVNHAARFLG